MYFVQDEKDDDGAEDIDDSEDDEGKLDHVDIHDHYNFFIFVMQLTGSRIILTCLQFSIFQDEL